MTDEIGYVPGRLFGKIKARRAWKHEDGEWRVTLESGLVERVKPDRVFPTREAAEAEALIWWPELRGKNT